MRIFLRIDVRKCVRDIVRIVVHDASAAATQPNAKIDLANRQSMNSHPTSQHKRATNLTLTADVLDAARELGINISQTVDDLLAREVRRRTVQKWAEDNAATLEAYNRRVAEHGLFNDDLRNLRGQV